MTDRQPGARNLQRTGAAPLGLAALDITSAPRPIWSGPYSSDFYGYHCGFSRPSAMLHLIWLKNNSPSRENCARMRFLRRGLPMIDDAKPVDENPDSGWPRHDRTEQPEVGLFVSEIELYRRLGVGPKTGRLAVHALEPHGFPRKQPLFGNKRYWPAVRYFLDRYYGLVESQSHQYRSTVGERKLTPRTP